MCCLPGVNSVVEYDDKVDQHIEPKSNLKLICMKELGLTRFFLF